MSKKQLLLLIIVGVVLGYLAVSKVNPTWGWSIDNIVGGAVGNAKTGIESTAIWQQYDVWFGVAFGAIISALLVYKGRDMYDGVRGIARVRATEPVKWQGAPPPAEPQPIQQLTQKAEPTPVPEVEKKEST